MAFLSVRKSQVAFRTRDGLIARRADRIHGRVRVSPSGERNEISHRHLLTIPAAEHVNYVGGLLELTLTSRSIARMFVIAQIA